MLSTNFAVSQLVVNIYEEESMDWWTKYFASVDAMIEVIKGRFLSESMMHFFHCPNNVPKTMLKKRF